jgi:hypothetical protein
MPSRPRESTPARVLPGQLHPSGYPGPTHQRPPLSQRGAYGQPASSQSGQSSTARPPPRPASKSQPSRQATPVQQPPRSNSPARSCGGNPARNFPRGVFFGAMPCPGGLFGDAFGRFPNGLPSVPPAGLAELDPARHWPAWTGNTALFPREQLAEGARATSHGLPNRCASSCWWSTLLRIIQQYQWRSMPRPRR